MAEGVLEVGGAPPDADEDLLVLYFESRRRSGGGPVRSCQRLGPLFILTFENPQGERGAAALLLGALVQTGSAGVGSEGVQVQTGSAEVRCEGAPVQTGSTGLRYEEVLVQTGSTGVGCEGAPVQTGSTGGRVRWASGPNWEHWAGV